ncbi:winged helix-turn-helix transcriptional regulator [Candidatus Bathyarchaeota archaeon]|nr:winged helix-turn-helix transcriptional regulator [Candidatus Bathyarchaeota archaeon]
MTLFSKKVLIQSPSIIAVEEQRRVPEGKEEIYSIMFKSLKHPIRRKILRILADKPLSFSAMLELLGISSSNLTYHLDNLGELVSKDVKGVYRLSTFGQASVNTMKVVEDAPAVPRKKRSAANRKWIMISSALLIGLILFASLAALEMAALNAALAERDSYESKYTQLLSWTSSTDDAIEFLRTVTQLDTAKYSASLLSRTVDAKVDLGGVPAETMQYSLVGTDSAGKTSRLTVQFEFLNRQFFRYQLTVGEGSPIYAQPQSPFVLDAAKNIVDRLYTYQTNGDYLANMSSLITLASQNTDKNLEIKQGNIKLNSTVSGEDADVVLEYTNNGVDFSRKCLEINIENGVLMKLTDSWGLYSIGNAEVNISSDRAVTLAKGSLTDFTFTSGGVPVTTFQFNTEPASVTFYPQTKSDTTLCPQWTVVFYLDKVYAGGMYQIAVTVWADTGEVSTKTALNHPISFPI